jgi:hypothetical protein
MSKYLIKDFKEGLYEYDTIFILKDKITYQIPIKKGLIDETVKEIDIEYFDRPIDK